MAEIQFEWDPAKALSNQAKHGVSFTEASTAFDDPQQWTISDPDHSTYENRFLTTGYTQQGELIIVSHTEETEDCIRIINARPATAAEQRIYEEGA